MNLFKLLWAQPLDKKRETVHAHLCSLGIDTELAGRGRPEELFKESREQSLSLIDIHKHITEWVNLVEGVTLTSRFGGKFYHRICGVGARSQHSSRSHALRFRFVRHKSRLGFGRAVEISWEDLLSPIEAETLSSNEFLKECLTKERVGVEVVSYPGGA